MTVLLDTNILVRHADPTDPAHSIVVAAITALQDAGEDLCIVPQNLYEFWVVATRTLEKNGLGLTIPECQKFVTGSNAAFVLLPDRASLFDEWESLVANCHCQGKVAHDARLVAAMRTHGLARLMTFNVGDFARYPGLTILDPATLASPSS